MDGLLKGALGLDSDQDEAGIPEHPLEASDQGIAHWQKAGSDSDEPMPDADDILSTPPEPASTLHVETSQDADGLKGTGLEDSDDDLMKDLNSDLDAEDAKTSTLPSKIERTMGPAEDWRVPLVPRPQESLHLITFKSMVDIESKPYIDEDFSLDETVPFDESGNRIHRAPALNRIRYRFNYEHAGTDLQMESNSRIVRWSDGTVSLMIGSECVDLKDDTVEAQRLLLGVKDPSSSTIQAQKLLQQRFVIRPPSLESKLHKNITLALSPENCNRNTVKANPILEDFAREHMDAVDRNLEQRKIRDKQNKVTQRKAAVGEISKRYATHRLTAAYLEADDEYEDGDEYGHSRNHKSNYDAAEALAEKQLLQTMQRQRASGGLLGDDDDENVVLSDDEEDPERNPRRQALMDSDDEF